jgi:hypothetical protein
MADPSFTLALRLAHVAAASRPVGFEDAAVV